MKKKINYDYLRTCINGFEFAIDWYNYWAGENNYPEITIDDLIKFLKQEKKKEVHEPIYLPKEIEPKRIDYGEIGCYPSIKVAGYAHAPVQVSWKHYNSSEDYYGGGHSYGYDSHKRHTITSMFNDICKIVFEQ